MQGDWLLLLMSILNIELELYLSTCICYISILLIYVDIRFNFC